MRCGWGLGCPSHTVFTYNLAILQNHHHRRAISNYIYIYINQSTEITQHISTLYLQYINHANTCNKHAGRLWSAPFLCFSHASAMPSQPSAHSTKHQLPDRPGDMAFYSETGPSIACIKDVECRRIDIIYAVYACILHNCVHHCPYRSRLLDSSASMWQNSPHSWTWTVRVSTRTCGHTGAIVGVLLAHGQVEFLRSGQVSGRSGDCTLKGPQFQILDSKMPELWAGCSGMSYSTVPKKGQRLFVADFFTLTVPERCEMYPSSLSSHFLQPFRILESWSIPQVPGTQGLATQEGTVPLRVMPL